MRQPYSVYDIKFRGISHKSIRMQRQYICSLTIPTFDMDHSLSRPNIYLQEANLQAPRTWKGLGARKISVTSTLADDDADLS